MIRNHPTVAATFLSAILLAATAPAADRFDAAVAQPGRPAADLARDAKDHPAGILRLTGIDAGMKVADVLAGDGYYSELLSYIVGPKGQVLLINNAAFDDWSEPDLQNRLSGNRLPNVSHQTVDLADMKLPPASLDAVLLVKVYHDLYWVNTEPQKSLAEDQCQRRARAAGAGPETAGDLVAGGPFGQGRARQFRCRRAASDRRGICHQGFQGPRIRSRCQKRFAENA